MLTRSLYLLLTLCLLLPTMSWGGNTHNLGSEARERAAWFADILGPAIVSGCVPSVPGSGLTLAGFACQGYFVVSGETIYVTQPSSAVTVPNSATVWLALHRDVSTTLSGCGAGNWTRIAGTHYVTCANSTQPANPTGGLVWGKVTVSGGNITAVERLVCPPPLRRTVFASTDHVRFLAPACDEIYPEWWGASPSATNAANTAAINAAIVAMNSTGIPVVLGTGTFTVAQEGANAWCINLLENTDLRGQGQKATIIKLANDVANFVRPLSTNSADADGVRRVRVSHLGVDGNKANQSVCVEHCACIFLSGVYDSTVEHTELFNCKGDGIHIHDGQIGGGAAGGSLRTALRYNLIHDVARVGINTDGGSYTKTHDNHIHSIVDNWCIKMEADAGGTARYGNSFTSNTCFQTEAGISIGGPGAATRYTDMIIANNIFDSDGGAGGSSYCIHLRAGDGHIVTGNVCRDFVSDAIFIDASVFDSVVTNNVVRLGGAGGIKVGGGSIACNERIALANNVLRGGGAAGTDGFQVTNCTPGAPREIAVVGNIATNYTSAGTAGIGLLAGTRMTAVGNVVGANANGMRLGGGGSAMVNPSLIGNMFAGNTTAGLASAATNDGLLLAANNFSGETVVTSGYPTTGGGADIKVGLNSFMWGYQAGTVTLDGASPTVVTLGTAEPNTNYRVTVTCATDQGDVFVDNKTTSGFSINSEAPHTGACEWHLLRDD